MFFYTMIFSCILLSQSIVFCAQREPENLTPEQRVWTLCGKTPPINRRPDPRNPLHRLLLEYEEAFGSHDWPQPEHLNSFLQKRRIYDPKSIHVTNLAGGFLDIVVNSHGIAQLYCSFTKRPFLQSFLRPIFDEQFTAKGFPAEQCEALFEQFFLDLNPLQAYMLLFKRRYELFEMQKQQEAALILRRQQAELRRQQEKLAQQQARLAQQQAELERQRIWGVSAQTNAENPFPSSLSPVPFHSMIGDTPLTQRPMQFDQRPHFMHAQGPIAQTPTNNEYQMPY